MIRSWEIFQNPGFDTTDGFATRTNIYSTKQDISLIEPSDLRSDSGWLTDKGRQFFDSLGIPAILPEKSEVGDYIQNSDPEELKR